MRTTALILTMLLLAIAASARAMEPSAAASADSRFPVAVSPADSLRQKTEMRSNVEELRDTLAKLADKDFPAAEKAIRHLAHTGPVSARPGASTKVFRDLESGFEKSIDKAADATRSGNTEVVLRALVDTMAFCQSCHTAFRQSVEATPPAAGTHQP